MLSLIVRIACAVACASALAPAPYATIAAAQVLDPRSGAATSALDGLTQEKKLVVLLPQVGEFDSCEMCEFLAAAAPALEAAGVGVRVIGVGDAAAGAKFAKFVGLPEGVLRVDPSAALHRQLDTKRGPRWTVPGWVSDGALEAALSALPGGAPKDAARLRAAGDSWLNYLLMCAGIGAPGTLAEIARGYFGDRSAPERLAPDAVVRAGFVKIGPGVGPVELGPFAYTNAWKDEAGYQRPVELATVRLRHMVEVLGDWDSYVTDSRYVDVRGATFLFGGDTEAPLYEYEHRGVLTYSATMARPLTFLAPHIGAVALNPLGLGDAGVADAG